MFAKFLKDAVWRLLGRAVIPGILCLVFWVCAIAIVVLTFAFGGVLGGIQGVIATAPYAAVAILVPGSLAVFRLQRGVRARSQLRGPRLESRLRVWGEPAEVRAWLDQDLADDTRQMRFEELCPLVLTHSWVVQVSQHGLGLARLDDIRGFRVRFRPIWPFTSVGDYHITLRLHGREPEVFLIEKDRHLDKFLGELIACNDYLNSAFKEEYYDFPAGLTGRDIVAGLGSQQGALNRSEVTSYIQEKSERMKRSGERTWVVGSGES